jgi:hypothetical protein
VSSDSWFNHRRVKSIVLDVERKEHKTPSNFRGPEKFDNCASSNLRMIVYRLRYFAKTLVKRPIIEVCGYPYPIFV